MCFSEEERLKKKVEKKMLKSLAVSKIIRNFATANKDKEFFDLLIQGVY